MQLSEKLGKKLDKALEILKARNPDEGLDRNQLIERALDRGLDALLRDEQRVPVDFQGTASSLHSPDMFVPIKVVDMSVSGAGFVIQEPGAFREDEIVILQFSQGDVHFHKTAIVQYVREERVGCAFVDPKGNKDIEAYLVISGLLDSEHDED